MQKPGWHFSTSWDQQEEDQGCGAFSSLDCFTAPTSATLYPYHLH
jgi:hypothetical protein